MLATTILFFSVLIQVFFIGMQQIQIIKQNMLMASLCSSCIACCNIFVFTTIPDSDLYTKIVYIMANALGVPLAMYLGNNYSKKKMHNTHTSIS